MKSFLERFLFPKDSWSNPREMLFDRHVFSAILYTMNNTESRAEERSYFTYFDKTERYFKLLFQETADHAYAFNTYGMTDYTKYRADKWDEDAKKTAPHGSLPGRTQNCGKTWYKDD